MTPNRPPAELYRYTVDPSSDAASARVWRFIGDRQRVLDLGAGPGSIARALVADKGCRVTAVDVDADCVEILRSFCERAVRVDLNGADWLSEVPSGPYDAVVIADVLEHLYDPWAVLDSAKTLLAPEGALIVSLPHSAHACLIACLLKGTFRYGEWGLLDRTHIRFFGMNNIQDLFAGAGLSVMDAAFVIRRPEETEFADLWAALSDQERSLSNASRFAGVYQVVLKAVPSERATDARSLEDFLELSEKKLGGSSSSLATVGVVDTMSSETRRRGNYRLPDKDKWPIFLDLELPHGPHDDRCVRKSGSIGVLSEQVMNEVVWTGQDEFEIDGLRFFCNSADYSPNQGDRYRFHVLKNKQFFAIYDDIFKNKSISNMLEVGFFDGGSTLYFLLRYDIKKMVAIDIRGRLEPFDLAISDHNLGDRVRVGYGVSQDSAPEIDELLLHFGGEDVDLIIDDASHLFDLSKSTFEISFPRLRAGGIYVLEDWGWAHVSATQQGGVHYELLKDHKSLANLLFLLQLLMISRPDLIESITVHSTCAVIKKGAAAASRERLSIDGLILNRGVSFNPV